MSDNPTTSPTGQLVSTKLRSTDTAGAAGQAFHGKSAPWVATGLPSAQVITVSTTVISSGAGLTIPTGATHAFISVEIGSIRFYNTGDTPTGANGHLLAPGAGPLEIDRLANLKMIRSGGSDAIVQISYHQHV